MEQSYRFQHVEDTCPTCNRLCPRHSRTQQILKGLRGSIKVLYAKYYCKICDKHFTSTGKRKVFGSHRRYTSEVRTLALSLLKEHTYKETSAALRKEGVIVTESTICDWIEEESPRARKNRAVRVRRPVEPGSVVVDKAAAGPGAGSASAGRTAP